MNQCKSQKTPESETRLVTLAVAPPAMMEKEGSLLRKV